MDTTQDHVEAQVQSYAQLDGGVSGQRMRVDLGPLLAAAEQASTAYLTAVERCPIEPDTKAPALRQAIGVFSGVRDQLAAADANLQAFESRIAPDLSRLDAALQDLAGSRALARTGLEKARMAVTGLTAAGYTSAAVAAKLDDVERRWREVSAGPGPGRDGLAAAVPGGQGHRDRGRRRAVGRGGGVLRDGGRHPQAAALHRYPDGRGRAADPARGPVAVGPATAVRPRLLGRS
ncbi:hypothetical protein [Fodinicola feengrottensis]|uniref:hypothetical protein n=1 Tax=Fodinicola feengrottensis TaxID=435914 RepID=UPI0013D30BD1|nr:hypothetical protein [Fodinicola feengrottensis]